MLRSLVRTVTTPMAQRSPCTTATCISRSIAAPVAPLSSVLSSPCSLASLSTTSPAAAAATPTVAPEYKYIYFNAKGRAEVTRLLFRIAGVPFEDYRYPFNPKTYECKEFRHDKSSLPFKRLPILQLGDGTTLAQAQAIHRFIARRHGLAGKNDVEAALTDTVMEVIEEVKQAWVDIVRMTDADKKKAVTDVWFTTKLPEYITCLNDYAAKYGRNGWLIGDTISVADVAFYVLMTIWCPDWRLGFDLKVLHACVNANEHVKRSFEQVSEHPAVVEWVRIRPETMT